MPLALLWSLPNDEINPLTLTVNDESTQTLGAYFAVILTASSQTFSLLLNNNPFKEAFFKLFKEELQNQKQCMAAQKAIFEYLNNAPHLAQATLVYMHKLLKLNLIDKNIVEYVQKISQIQVDEKRDSLHVKLPEGFDFHAIKSSLLQIGQIANEKLCLQESFKKEWSTVTDSLKNAQFSIGITGVMNAGKSTLLNALLKDEILGTSTIPETANLTIISYSKKPFAKVHFWKKSEWEQIEKSALINDSMMEFVQQTKALIGQDWDKFITQDGYVKTIDPKDLAKFTSATISKGRCNIVKSVELGLDTPLAKDGVSIVDTPGLDDPIIQREEITKSYLANCDVMVHLMNASQSATQKDVDFIIDALTYQRISHLVLVITRIDKITQESLKEVIEYTKRSISQRLKTLDKPHLIDPILSKISIFPVSALYALMHRTKKDKEALKDGWSIEKTGILDFEKHLNELLFGGQRAHIMLRAASKSMTQILEKQEDALWDEKRLLSQSAKDLEQKKEALNARQAKLKKEIEIAKSDLDELIFTCKEHLSTMQNVAKGKLKRLQNQIHERLSSDVLYSIKKSKKYPAKSRLETIVATTMSDGLIDLVREYRFMLFKYLDAKLSSFTYKHKGVLKEIEFGFDPKAYQEEAAKSGILSTNHTILSQNAAQTILAQKSKNANVGLENLKKVIAEGFEPIELRVIPLLEKSGMNMILELNKSINTPIETAVNGMLLESKNLEAALLHVKKDSTSSKKRIEFLEDQIKVIKTLKDQITSCMKVA